MRLGRFICFIKELFLLGLITACGAGSGKNLHGEDPLAQLVPYWANITYTLNGQTETLLPPFVTTQSFSADAGTGACTGNLIELVLSGSYNPEKVSNLELTGLTSTVSFSGNSFTFVACMAPGSASVTITAYDKDSKPIRLPLTVSLSAMTATKTLAFGHPRYPNTGFVVTSAVKNVGSSTVSMGSSLAKKQTTSTGNTGFTMETGFVNYVREVSP